MNLHALRLFHTVAENGNVTRAAEQLNISQPAVTSQIKKLEQELRLTLIVPKGRGILLTEAGMQLARHAKRLFSLESEIEEHIERLKCGKAGKLRIVATYLPANFLLPKWIAGYKTKHSDVDVILTSANSYTAIEQLLNYKADIACIGGMNDFAPAVERRLLFEDEMWFVTHKDHHYASKICSLAKVVNEPFVIREEGSSSREKLMALCRVNSVNTPKVGLQINGLHETIRAVMEGYGITFVSALEVKEYIARREIARIFVEGADLKNPISICTRKDDILSPPAQHFIRSIH